MNILIASLALAGTLLQYRDAVGALNREKPQEAAVFRVVDDWKHEVPWWRVVSWWHHRKSVRQVLSESPSEAIVYRRLFSVIVSWALLTGAASLGFLSAIAAELRPML